MSARILAIFVCAAAFGFHYEAANARHGDDDGTVECHSDNYQYNECHTPFRSAALVRQLSDSDCIENKSWGFNQETGYVWVSAGCAGRFGEGSYADQGAYDRDDRRHRHRHDDDDNDNDDRRTDSGYDYDPTDGGGSALICESRGGDRERCPLPRGVREVHIDDQLSQTVCRRGENWDYDDREVWVSDGCRARFRYWTR